MQNVLANNISSTTPSICAAPESRQAIDADTESDDSEHGGKGSKLLSLEGEGHRLDQSSAGRRELSSEAPSRDESMMENLMERFEEVYKQAQLRRYICVYKQVRVHVSFCETTPTLQPLHWVV